MFLIKYINKQFFYLAVLSFGINLCFAFQLTNLSTIFKFLGAKTAELPLLWLIPPLTGMIMQPLIGQISDDTSSRFGKRRPYIFVFGSIAAMSFLFMPLVNSLIFALVLMWIIDCSLNGSAESLRALTGDVMKSEQDRSRAFALQAFASGIGGVLGTVMPFMLHHAYNFMLQKEIINAGSIPINLKLSFFVTSIILFISLFFSLNKIKEKQYKHQDFFSRRKKPSNFFDKTHKTFRDLYKSFKNMPPRFKQICLIHGLTWNGIFIFWLFFTVTIAQNLYGLPIHASPNSSAQDAVLLHQAALTTSVYFSVYQYVSLAYAILLYFISLQSRIILWHVASLVVGGIGIMTVSLASTKFALLVGCMAFGIMWGSILVLPYAIALKVLPKGKLGTYLGIFNISITAPQIICGLLLMPIYSYVFKGHAGYLLIAGSCLVLLSAFLWKRLEPNYTKSSSLTILDQEFSLNR